MRSVYVTANGVGSWGRKIPGYPMGLTFYSSPIREIPFTDQANNLSSYSIYSTMKNLVLWAGSEVLGFACKEVQGQPE